MKYDPTRMFQIKILEMIDEVEIHTELDILQDKDDVFIKDIIIENTGEKNKNGRLYDVIIKYYT